ncbi:hypothetical protein V8G54_006474 [Vigna mungo]|uniref:RanBP2-type domain-containing protein n=1 Tax=Vigna mungo TaxID=3915 RepID=A0AAQ3P1Z4_VIGMU
MSWSGGDWMCGACQHINFKKRDSCQTCGYPKFGGPDPTTYRYNWTEALAGDWYCSSMNCGAHNYASRSSCYRCGALKDGYSCRFGGNMDPCGGYASDCPPGWKTELGVESITMRAEQNVSSAKHPEILVTRTERGNLNHR